MKAMTLTQPWASLVALGAKNIETRSWTTAYRGPLAIHAAKTFGVWKEAGIRAMFEQFPEFEIALQKQGWGLNELPRSAMVATCQLVGIVRTEVLVEKHVHEWTGSDGWGYRFELTHDESIFGDYTPGRYAWLLADVRQLPIAYSARGALGLWEWTPTEPIVYA
jgi:activating signal cointegrator 1